MITVLGNVISDGRWCGNPPGELLVVVVVVVDVPVPVVVVVVVVVVTVVVVVVVLVVGVVVVAGVGVEFSLVSMMMPQMISPISTAMVTPQPTNAHGLRQPGMGSDSGSAACPVGSLAP